MLDFLISTALTMAVLGGVCIFYSKLSKRGRFIFWAVIFLMSLISWVLINLQPMLQPYFQKGLIDREESVNDTINDSSPYDIPLLISFIASFIVCCIDRRWDIPSFKYLTYISSGIMAGFFHLFTIESDDLASNYANPFYGLGYGGYAYFVILMILIAFSITIYMIVEDIKDGEYVYPANIFFFLCINLFRFTFAYLVVGFFLACIDNLWLFLLFIPAILPMRNFVLDKTIVSMSKDLEREAGAAESRKEAERKRYESSGNDYGDGGGSNSDYSSSSGSFSNSENTNRDVFEREECCYGYQCYYYEPNSSRCRFYSGGGEDSSCNCVNGNAKFFCPNFRERK